MPRRLVIVLMLVFIGLATGFWAVALFPSRPSVKNPTTFVVLISTKVPLQYVFLVVDQGTQSANITVEPEAANSVSLPNEPQKVGFVEFSVYGSKNSISCPSGVTCSFQVTQGEGVAFASVPIVIGGSNNTGKDYNITVKYPHLGYAANGESAIDDFPAAHILPPSSSVMVLSVTFYEHNANIYDWSLPPIAALSEGIRWDEPLSNSLYAAQPMEITGTNLQAQAQDVHNTFIAGILLGVAGAAAIAAAEEGLHMIFDNRDNRRQTEPSRQTTSS